MRRLLDSPALHVLLILGVAIVLILPSLGSTSLWDIDEGLNAEAAREMFERGDYVVPQFNFKPRTAKPPLLYWLQATAYQTFGVNEFAARLPSAIAMALAALLTYRLGRRMFSPVAGLLAALILLSNVQASILAHAATPDAVLLLCLVFSMTLFWDGYSSGGTRWLWLPGIGCGLSALAKGPIGLVLPVAIVGYFLIAQRQLRRLWDWRILGGAFLVILVAGPWYGLVGAETHGKFLRAFWQHDNVNRFVNAMEGHRGPFWYYAVTLTLGLTPWCIFLIPTLWDAYRSVSPRFEGNENRVAVRFLICWAVVYFAFFSLAQTKLPNYVFPVFPPLAILMGRYLDRWRIGESAAPAWLAPAALSLLVVIGAGTIVGMLIASGLLFPHAIQQRAIQGLAPWAILGAIPMVGAAAAWRWYVTRKPEAVLASITLTAIVFLGVAAAGPIHIVDRQKAPKHLIADAGAFRPTQEIRIASFCYFQPSLVFYAQREIPELATDRQALDFLCAPLPSYLICPADVARILQAQLPAVQRLAVRRDFYKGWEVVVLGNELCPRNSLAADITVVQNRP
jgi:4-amino-4-deoxy-L-arabinose transferase-like glycosyltransferase